ncbi:SLC13 family permease [Actinomycetospora sp. NBRC 106378]|uniref:GntT/GntP/DsdX family permease n=1 Tax=Actinomycetospora sp. NBRC 106378 TaxID=3032208 RepID=UPI0024A4BBE8|nr:SLC13 family permease [Actinomycetospora sp. NBRC 106378]GLZ56012.1 GntP family transporter [Actinomycetospora sp. NBRC 106378]
MWTTTDTRLVITAAASVALVIVLITSRLRLHAFPALMTGSLVLGLVAGLGPSKTVGSFTDGVGGTLGDVGVVLGLGTMLGKLLADSGGADLLADTLLRRSGPRMLPWAVALLAMVLGIPLFFEIGVVLVLPIVFTVAVRLDRERGHEGGRDEQGRSTILRVGIPALAGLSALHAFIPPHPGPLVAIDALKADLGQTLLVGIVLAVPTVAVAGPLFAHYASRWAHAEPPASLVRTAAPVPGRQPSATADTGRQPSATADTGRQPSATADTGRQPSATADTGRQPSATADTAEHPPPGLTATLATILLPVVLMLLRTVADVVTPDGSGVRAVAEFVGEPVVALLLALLLATWTFGFRRGLSGSEVSSLAAAGLVPAASILVIIGAGGGFKQVLVDSGIGDSLAKAATGAGIPVLLLAWFVAVLIRLATGSATVATVTAAGIVAPVLAAEPSASPVLAALAVGAGSVFFSHVNDAGFWLVREYFGMSVRDTFRTWSVMETLVSVVGLLAVLAASLVV